VGVVVGLIKFFFVLDRMEMNDVGMFFGGWFGIEERGFDYCSG
jgi:hypothetical protein